MSVEPRLTIVIPTLGRTQSLDDLLLSIMHQQATPSFEVIVVANWPEPKLEQHLLAWDKRLKYVCLGRRSVNAARNLGLRHARGEVTLFLDDDCWIEDPLFLKRHFDFHQKAPEAIGIGGRYALKRGANLFERAAHWLTDLWLSRSRIDNVRSLNLVGGNASFKTVALRTAFAFNEQVVFGGSEADLNARLVASGHELHLSEKLFVEHRLRLRPFKFVEKLFLRGRSTAIRTQQGLVPHWRFQGARVSLERHIEDHGGRLTRSLRAIFWLGHFAYQAGLRDPSSLAGSPHPRHPQILNGLGREGLRRLADLGNSPFVTEMFYALKYAISRR